MAFNSMNSGGTLNDQSGDSIQGGSMIKRMVAKNGPVRGTKEYFATLQKQGRIKRGPTKVYGNTKGF